MTDVIKVLGQSAPDATTATDLYTAPALAQVTCSSLVVCNRSASGVTFRVAVRPAGATLANQHYLAYDKALFGNDNEAMIYGMTLSETDVVTVYASDANLSFTLFGVETT